MCEYIYRSYRPMTVFTSLYSTEEQAPATESNSIFYGQNALFYLLQQSAITSSSNSQWAGQKGYKALTKHGLLIFFGRGSELQMHQGNILWLNNKHMKLFVIKQSKGCKFTPRIHQNTFGGHAPPRAAGGCAPHPKPHSRNGGYF